MNKIIELRNIRVSGTKRDRLKNVNLSIKEGEKVALIGASGSGKTSLISVANGSLKPDEGNVFWKGHNLHQLSNRKRRGIATLWQDLRLVEQLNVAQNVNAGALGRHGIIWSIRNLLGTIEKKECIACLEAAGLSRELLKANLNQLSGGQSQRVALARLLRQNGELILADEPISSLDPSLIKKVLMLLLSSDKNLNVKVPISILITLHRPDLINLFDRVIGIIEGEIVLDSPSREISDKSISWLYKSS